MAGLDCMGAWGADVVICGVTPLRITELSRDNKSKLALQILLFDNKFMAVQNLVVNSLFFSIA
jgi:hypothetical protein